MNLSTVLFQKPFEIPKGAGRFVTNAQPDDMVIEYSVKKNRICTRCGAKDNGTNFYRLGARCKSCQKEDRCLRK